MHAYMIIAHNQFKLLEKLILVLDDKRNDIYIHIDAKVKDFDFDYFLNLPRESSISFTDRISITWGDISVVKAEMILLNASVKNQEERQYTHYHMISGVDFPIKSNDYIHNFLSQNDGLEFIHFTSNTCNSEDRLKYYHLFRGKRNFINKLLAQIVLKVEKLIGINRLKNTDIAVQKGCNWFTVTYQFAKYVVDTFPKYEKYFNYSYCCDEVFIQTIIINSPFKNSIFYSGIENDHFSALRLIDWQRGNPYTFKDDDFDLIINSKALFARKFDYENYPQIVDKLFNYLK